MAPRWSRDCARHQMLSRGKRCRPADPSPGAPRRLGHDGFDARDAARVVGAKLANGLDLLAVKLAAGLLVVELLRGLRLVISQG